MPHLTIFEDVQNQIDQAAADAGGKTFFPDQQVYDAMNAAILELSADLRYQLTSATLSIGSGNDIISLPTTSIMIPQFIITPNNVKIFPTTHPMLQDWNANWRNMTPAEPQWIVLWDETHLRLWPSSNASYSFTLWGVPWPTQFDSGNKDLDADSVFSQALVHRSVALILEATQPQLADVQMQESEQHLKMYKKRLRNQQGDNILRLRPGVGWSIAQMGDINIGRKYSI